MNSLFGTDKILSPRTGCFVLLAGLLAGCGRDDIQVYKVAKDTPQASASAAAQNASLPPGHPDMAASAQPSLKWTLPAGWEEQAPGEMRVASFRVKGEGGKSADVSVIPLPGMAGGELNNVNRWRSQVGQPAVSEEQLAKLAEPVEIDGQKAQLYDQAGQNAGSGESSRILAAVLQRSDMVWFFKMSGDAALVAQQKPAFVAFLKSVSLSAQAKPSELPPSHPPIGAPEMTMAQPGMTVAPAGGAASSGQAKPNWQVPAGWQEVSGGQFLVAKFLVSGADQAQAQVNVSMSGGEGGGLAANVNRWRGQLGLGQLAEADLTKQLTPIDISGGKAMLVEMTGTDARTGQKARLVGAVVPQGGQTWFYKLMGNEQLVEQQKAAFTKFVQGVKY